MSSPWSYTEGFSLGFILLLIGFTIEVATHGQTLEALQWPKNLQVGIIYLFLIITIWLVYRKNIIVQFLASIPAAISSISLFTFLVLILGYFPDNDPNMPEVMVRLGLQDVKHSWPFLLTEIYLITTLGFVTAKRIIPFKKQNIGFILNHLGLWIVLLGGTLGAGDMQRIKMNLFEDVNVGDAYDHQGNRYEMPLSMKLLDFEIEEYNPKIAIVDSLENIINMAEIRLLELNKKVTIGNYTIEPIQILKSSVKVGEQYHAVNEFGAVSSAKIKISTFAKARENKKTLNTKASEIEDWIASGNFMYGTDATYLGNGKSLIMLQPEAKKFNSTVYLQTQSGRKDTIQIQVNKPIKVGKWKIYQLSYNEKMGRWSNLSVVELIRDPWLPVVYLGIFMLLAGSIYLFWQGKSFSDKGAADKK